MVELQIQEQIGKDNPLRESFAAITSFVTLTTEGAGI